MSPPTSPWTLTARWVFPVDGPPLSRGTVTVRGHRIDAVESQGARSADVDLGNVAVLPGLVNAHTHLDLSGLRGRCPPSPDFVGWLKSVIRHRRSVTREETLADIRAGLAECRRFGTTLVGDICGGVSSREEIGQAPVRGVVFRELLGLTAERAGQAYASAAQELPTMEDTATVREALSPHAPYSVRADLFRRAAELARDDGRPLATHLAETVAEIELLRDHAGPFVPFLRELGVWDPEGLVEDVQHVLRLTDVPVPLLYVHGNYLPADVSLPPHGTVVYCPRTHAAFGHPPHPFRTLLARGVRVALGTDGLASNPDLDLLAEARFMHQRYPDFLGDSLLRMATLSGAEALGWADETGSLTPGKSADLVVLPLPDQDVADPHRLLFDSTLPARATLFRGAWSYPDSALKTDPATPIKPP